MMMRSPDDSSLASRSMWGCRLLLAAAIVMGPAAVLAQPASEDQSQTQTQSQAQPPVQPTFPEVVKQIRGSVVAIGTYRPRDEPSARYYGTGFVLDDGLMVATNAHVVDAMRVSDSLDDLRVFFEGERAPLGRPARLITSHRLHDIALLRFEGQPAPPLDLQWREMLAPGETIGVMGYPIGMALGVIPAVHRGVVAAVVPSVLPLPRGARVTPDLADAIRNPYELYQLDIVVMPGHSGSPLFDPRTGQVIGIINKALGARTREHLISQPTGIGYAVPARWIHQYLLEAKAAERRRGQASHPPEGAPVSDASSSSNPGPESVDHAQSTPHRRVES